MNITFNDIQFNTHPSGDGVQGFVKLPNGYKVSVIQNDFSYGGEEGLWEIGFMNEAGLVHVPDWYDQVVGYLDEQQVIEKIYWLYHQILNGADWLNQ